MDVDTGGSSLHSLLFCFSDRVVGSDSGIEVWERYIKASESSSYTPLPTEDRGLKQLLCGHTTTKPLLKLLFGRRPPSPRVDLSLIAVLLDISLRRSTERQRTFDRSRFRLIDTFELRLVHPDQPMLNYVTLSYMWGNVLTTPGFKTNYAHLLNQCDDKSKGPSVERALRFRITILLQLVYSTTR